MKKWVIFEFGNGSFEKGFPVTVSIGTDGIKGSDRDLNSFLPSAPSSLTKKFLDQWRKGFEDNLGRPLNLAIKPIASTQEVSIEQPQFPKLNEQLENYVKTWLKSQDDSWSQLITTLLVELHKDDEIRVIIQTDNYNLRRLPWHVWELFSKYFPQSEFSFSPLKKEKVTRTYNKYGKVKILQILGEPELEKSQKVDYQSDIKAVEKLGAKLGADLEILPQPSHKELINKLWEKDWQIIFYSGHSDTEEAENEIKGRLFLEINKNQEKELISIDELKETFRELILVKKSLQLVIFNSCQGLGLAKQLEDLALPQVIVMREKVPDFVAQMFLQDFLTAFAGGDGQRYLHDALREARKKIHDKYKNIYPGIAWLPVICQQYADGKPLIFNDLRQTGHGDGDDELLKLLGELIQAERARKFQLVIQLGEKLLKRYPQNKIARIKTTFAYIQRILNYYNQGKYDEAIQDCDRAILLTPENAEVYYQYARAYHQKNEWEKVIENCTQAIRLKKESDYYWQRGRAYCNQSNYDQAINDAQTAISINRKIADYHYLLGFIFYQQGLSILLKATEQIFNIYDQKKSNQAIQLYRQGINALNEAIKINPKVANYFWIRGFCYFGIGENDQAINDFHKANQLDPNSKTYDYNYWIGLSYFNKKNYDSAISYLNSAIGILNESKNPDYYYYLSYSYYNRDYSYERNYNQWYNLLRNYPDLKTILISNNPPESDVNMAKQAIKKAIDIEAKWQYSVLENQIEERIIKGMSGDTNY
ncbi:CHAT domain-containing tetratricopeptide repeat protein [Planktothrix mougeotii]|uniref:Tetratricopeptide repeat protein n=1 Tax=Planktothrix mougeotii LEGE 06226 TaxID=1828728 RepID=A0ABR9UIL8_9CYAN|nr:tetratricopeptide repeat protein [Planktothrix mougeotii]MBE9145424.1 tetratricopeptide repeat protein [Planktothrix mougeotii LEGE 06226]